MEGLPVEPRGLRAVLRWTLGKPTSSQVLLRSQALEASQLQWSKRCFSKIRLPPSNLPEAAATNTFKKNQE